MDTSIVRNLTKKLVTVEEHYVIGGLGTIVQEVCAEAHLAPVKKIGLPHCYATSGPYNELLSYYGLDVQGIEQSVLDFVEKGYTGDMDKCADNLRSWRENGYHS